MVGIHAVDLVLGFGTLHCLTQQEPWEQGGLPAGPRFGRMFLKWRNSPSSR